MAFVVQKRSTLIYQIARPCAANSSFDGKLQALLDAIEYSPHPHWTHPYYYWQWSGYQSCYWQLATFWICYSLAICKRLNNWFSLAPVNTLEIHWFPGHMGLELNEHADTVAGSSFPWVNPKPCITTTSCRRSFSCHRLVYTSSTSPQSTSHMPQGQTCSPLSSALGQKGLTVLWSSSKQYRSLWTLHASHLWTCSYRQLQAQSFSFAKHSLPSRQSISRYMSCHHTMSQIFCWVLFFSCISFLE